MLDDFKNTQPLFLKYVSKIIQNGKISHAYLIETNLLSFFADNIETLLWEGFIMAKDEKKPTATMTME